MPSRSPRFVPRAAVLCGCLASLACAPAPAQMAAGQVSVALDPTAIEVIRAWRRARHLDPPDPAADERLRQLLQREAAERGQRAAVPTGAGEPLNCVSGQATPTGC